MTTKKENFSLYVLTSGPQFSRHISLQCFERRSLHKLLAEKKEPLSDKDKNAVMHYLASELCSN